ncbi:MAG: Tn3 family transposase [Dehalobacterium sp.]
MVKFPLARVSTPNWKLRFTTLFSVFIKPFARLPVCPKDGHIRTKAIFLHKAKRYHKIENIIQGKINKKIIQENYDDVLRLTHSIREGKVSGSLIMSKLGSYAWQNALATALRERLSLSLTIFRMNLSGGVSKEA